MKNTRVQHFDILKQASLVDARKRPQDLLDEKLATQNNDAMLRDLELNTRKSYLLERRFTPHVGDIPFDHTSARRIVSVQVAGTRTLVLTYRVPNGTDLIVNQYAFFILVDNYNPNPFPREFAYPLEFAQYFSFDVKVNGKTPVLFTNYFDTGNPDPQLNRTGVILLSRNPEDFSPNHDGMHFVAPRGSLLTIEIVCHTNTPGAWNSRNPYVAGSRIRGFLTSSEDLDKKNK